MASCRARIPSLGWHREPSWSSFKPITPPSSIYGRSWRRNAQPSSARGALHPAVSPTIKHKRLLTTTPRLAQADKATPNPKPKFTPSDATLDAISNMIQNPQRYERPLTPPSNDGFTISKGPPKNSSEDLQRFYNLDKSALKRPATLSSGGSTGTAKTPGYQTSAPAPLNTQAMLAESSRQPQLPRMRLTAALGRTVNIAPNRGLDLARAFNLLRIKIATSNIRGESAKQRYHERPGLKRKRLRSENWRRRFMTGFQAMVAQVRHMKRQGW